MFYLVCVKHGGQFGGVRNETGSIQITPLAIYAICHSCVLRSDLWATVVCLIDSGVISADIDDPAFSMRLLAPSEDLGMCFLSQVDREEVGVC